MRGHSVVAAVAIALLMGIATTASATKGNGAASYLEPASSNIHIYPIINAGESVNLKPNGSPYPFVGNPDGLGAFDNGDGTFTVLVNHEIPGTAGVVHAHGSVGAFVSKWTVRKGSLRVEHGEDLINTVMRWNGAGHVPAATTFQRFCSADLPPTTALYNASTGRGFDGRLFLNGEEAGFAGRAWAHGLDGTTYELPHLGKIGFENLLANPVESDTTLVIVNDDTAPTGQVYVYVGTKQSVGSPVERAGLTGGTLYGVRVDGVSVETGATTIAPGTRFSLYALGDVSGWTGSQLQTASVAGGVTEFGRPEDGAWDPSQPSHYYVNTTTTSRLWRLRFDDIANPTAGGFVDMLLDGTEGQLQPDNMAMSSFGQVFIQEDPGNVAGLAKVWRYDIASGLLDPIASHSPTFFTASSPQFLTTDEESSGMIDASDILGQGWFLLVSQAHKALGGELVEMGQLLAMHVPPGQPAGN